MYPTPEQRAILDAVQDRPENLAVNAVAGAGKTSTLVQSCAGARGPAGFLAFNKHIAAELKSRLNGAAEALTLHGLGYRTLCRSRGSIPLDERKTTRHLERLFPKLFREGRGRWAGRKFLKDEWAGLPDAVGVCKQRDALPSEDAEGTVRAWYRQDVDLPPDSDRLSVFVGYVEESLAESGEDLTTCDYDDMIYLPVRHGLVRPEYATLFVDEGQDLNPAQQELALSAGSRIVLVGDPNQAIMGFAGAAVNGFRDLCVRLNSAGGLCEFPLSYCFRCPESHLELARLLVPRIRPAAFAADGEVVETTVAHLEANARPGDMVLCRNTAPLLRLAFQLIQARVPLMVRGRKIGDSLKALVRQLRPGDITDLIRRLATWEEQQREKLEAADAPEVALEALADRANSLRALCGGAETLDELTALMDTLFSDDDGSGRALLSTVHRAKGLEADRVWLYQPGLMPARASDPQELNLLYVALTRAKESLFLVDGGIQRKDSVQTWIARIADGESRFDLTERLEGD